MHASAQARPQNGTGTRRLYCDLAGGDADLRESQALRYRVFGEELGARLPSAALGLDVDAYDPYCHHLLVRETGSDRVVASTRLLADVRAAEAGGFYSESEFDLADIRRLSARGLRLLEVGRTCVDPAFRTGSAIAVLWSGLAAYVRLHGFHYLFGCASIGLDGNGAAAAAVLARLREHAPSPPGVRVSPRRPVQLPAPGESLTAPMPALLKAYVRLGARVCGEPCLDPEFNVADVLMLLRLEELDPTYERHFLGRLQRP
jgi:putative hemolysin